MGIFKRHKPPQRCPQCGQLIDADALECDMCGFDMREAQPTPVGAGGQRSD